MASNDSNGKSNGKGSSKIALPSEDQDNIRRANKARHGGNRRSQQHGSNKQLSIPEEGNKLHLQLVLQDVTTLQLNELRASFVKAIMIAYAETTRQEVKDQNKSRVGIAFSKVEAKVGTDKIRTCRKDWEQAKRSFLQIVHTHPLKGCMDAVAEERRKVAEQYRADQAHVSTTLSEFAGDRLQSLLRELQPA